MQRAWKLGALDFIECVKDLWVLLNCVQSEVSHRDFRRATKVLAIARVNDAATTGSWNHHFSSTTGAGFSSTTGAWQKGKNTKKQL